MDVNKLHESHRRNFQNKPEAERVFSIPYRLTRSEILVHNVISVTQVEFPSISGQQVCFVE